MKFLVNPMDPDVTDLCIIGGCYNRCSGQCGCNNACGSDCNAKACRLVM